MNSRLVEVQAAGRLPALEADRPDLGQAVVIDDARAPALLDALARRRNAAAGLARDDEHADAAVARAVGRSGMPSCRRPRPAAARRSACSTRPWRRRRRSSPAAAGWTCRRRARSARRSGSRHRTPAQNPRNGPNENGKKTRSPGPTRAAAIHRLPAVEHPLPALVRVDPAQRAAGRRRRLAIPRVALDRLGEGRAPRRVRVPGRRRARALVVSGKRRQIVRETAARRSPMPAASSLRV